MNDFVNEILAASEANSGSLQEFVLQKIEVRINFFYFCVFHNGFNLCSLLCTKQFVFNHVIAASLQCYWPISIRWLLRALLFPQVIFRYRIAVCFATKVVNFGFNNNSCHLFLDKKNLCFFSIEYSVLHAFIRSFLIIAAITPLNKYTA